MASLRKRVAALEHQLKLMQDKVAWHIKNDGIRYLTAEARLEAVRHIVLSTHSATDANLEMLLDHLGLEVVHIEDEWHIVSKEAEQPPRYSRRDREKLKIGKLDIAELTLRATNDYTYGISYQEMPDALWAALKEFLAEKTKR